MLTGTVKSLSRGSPQEPGWAVLSVLALYKPGGLGEPPPSKGSPLRLRLPCRLCPAMKKGDSTHGCPPPEAGWVFSGSSLQVLTPPLPKFFFFCSPGSSYVVMGKVGEDGGALLPPDAFVVPFRPQQQQVLGNLSKRPCRGTP